MDSTKKEEKYEMASILVHEEEKPRGKRQHHSHTHRRHSDHRPSKESSVQLPPFADLSTATAEPSVLPRPLVPARGIDVTVRGVLEGAVCHEAESLFARTYWVHGPDWTPLSVAAATGESSATTPLVTPLEGQMQSEVITQLSSRSSDPFARFTWAAPFECALRGTNPHGWPQLVVTLHTVSRALPTNKAPQLQRPSSGGEKCLSYSRCFIPLRSGTYRKKLPLMQLVPNTKKQSWINFFTGDYLELRDPAFLCSGEDRGILTAAPLHGHVSLCLSVIVNGFMECGIEP